MFREPTLMASDNFGSAWKGDTSMTVNDPGLHIAAIVFKAWIFGSTCEISTI
jgi:hypothetical protein